MIVVIEAKPSSRMTLFSLSVGSEAVLRSSHDVELNTFDHFDGLFLLLASLTEQGDKEGK